MPELWSRSEVLIWSDLRRSEAMRAVIERVHGLQVLAVGGPRKSDLADLAGALGAKLEGDLRKMVLEYPGKPLLLASDQGIYREEVGLALNQGGDVLALDPPAAGPEQWPGASERAMATGGAGRLVVLPLTRLTPIWRSAAEPEQAIGALRSFSFISLTTPALGSLFARLFDAMDVALKLLGMPETIDASLSGPLTEPPEHLPGLTGHLAGHLRYGGNRSASIQVSDRAATWTQRLAVLGTDGQLLMEDHAYQLHAADGTLLDGSSIEEGDSPWSAAVKMIAEQCRWLLDHPGPIATDGRKVLACCAAALLSCRTGQPESPGTLMKMAGV